ncbi:MAG: hypothetical protein DRN06_07510, partial [Thermoprotei archaeon]
DLGGPGKEPMVRLLGRTATEVAERAVEAVRMVLRGSSRLGPPRECSREDNLPGRCLW